MRNNNDINSQSYAKVECLGISSKLILICTMISYENGSLINISLFSKDLAKKEYLMKVEKLDISNYTKMIIDTTYNYIIIGGSNTLSIYTVETGVLVFQYQSIKNILEIFITKNNYIFISEVCKNSFLNYILYWSIPYL